MYLMQNEAAEQYVLGAILYEPDLIESCSLTTVDFYGVRHQIIFNAFKRIADKGEKIVPPLVLQVVGTDRLSEIGGISYLAQLVASIATTADFEINEQIVKSNSAMRRLVNQCKTFVNNPEEDAVLNLQKAIEAYISDTANEASEASDRETLIELINGLDEDPGSMSGVPTGSEDLDKMTNGFQGGELILVAARPSMGKSAFVTNVGLKAAGNGVRVDLFSMEMSKKDIMKRALSSISNIDGGKWRNPKRLMSNSDFQRLIEACGIYARLPIRIHDDSWQTVMSIQSKVRKSIRDCPDQKHIVIIDYLDYVKAIGKFDRGDEAIGSITKGLKQMARKYDLPVILVCQLNRGVEGRQDKRPTLGDLRNSGNLEQDADMILFLYREDYYSKETDDQNIAEIIVAKQRNGPTGTVEMAFLKAYSKFVDLDRQLSMA